MKHLFGSLAFLMLLCLYLTVIYVLGQIAPLLFFFALLAWMVIRKPLDYPKRVNSDIRRLAEEAGRMLQRLAEILTYPLTNIK